MVAAFDLALALLAASASASPIVSKGQWQKKILTRPTNGTTVGSYRTSPVQKVAAPGNATHGPNGGIKAEDWYSNNWAGATLEASSVRCLRVRPPMHVERG
jgi:hypothetical protein